MATNVIASDEDIGIWEICEQCWNLLVASSAAARIFDGLARRFVYMCYLDVDKVYNCSYIECTGTRLPRSPPTSRSPR